MYSYVVFSRKIGIYLASGDVDKDKYDEMVSNMNEFFSKAIQICYKGGIHVFRENLKSELNK